METNETVTFQVLAVLPDCSSLRDGVTLSGKFKEPLALVYSELTSPEVLLNDQ